MPSSTTTEPLAPTKNQPDPQSLLQPLISPDPGRERARRQTEQIGTSALAIGKYDVRVDLDPAYWSRHSGLLPRLTSIRPRTIWPTLISEDRWKRCALNRRQLVEMAREAGIQEDAFSLAGGMPPETHVLEVVQGGWNVYYSERGRRTGSAFFKTEDEACSHLFDLLIRDPTTRSR